MTIINDIIENIVLGLLVLIVSGLLYVILYIIWDFITEVGYDILYLIPIVAFLAVIGYITKPIIRGY